MGRHARPDDPANVAIRLANRGRKLAGEAEQPLREAEDAVKRFYRVLSSTLEGYERDAVVELELTAARARSLISAGHIAPADSSDVSPAVPAVESSNEAAPAADNQGDAPAVEGVTDNG